MSIEDYITQKVKQNGAKVRITQYLDVDGYAKEIADEVDDQLLHAVATQKGYVKERTCHLVETDDHDGRGNSYGKSIRCSSCGKPLKKNLAKGWSGIQFCYRCGAKVVD